MDLMEEHSRKRDSVCYTMSAGNTTRGAGRDSWEEVPASGGAGGGEWAMRGLAGLAKQVRFYYIDHTRAFSWSAQNRINRTGSNDYAIETLSVIIITQLFVAKCLLCTRHLFQALPKSVTQPSTNPTLHTVPGVTLQVWPLRPRNIAGNMFVTGKKSDCPSQQLIPPVPCL